MFKKLIITCFLLINAPLGLRAAAVPEFLDVSNEIKAALLELHAVDASTAQTFYETCGLLQGDTNALADMPQTIRAQIPLIHEQQRQKEEEARKEREADERFRIMMAEQQRVLDQAGRALRGEPEPVFVPLPDPVEENATSGAGTPPPLRPSQNKKSHFVSNSLMIGGLSVAGIALVRELKKARKDFKTQQSQENKETPEISTIKQITQIFKLCGTNIKSKRTKGTRIALTLAATSFASGVIIRAFSTQK
jgi:hypothetical protein